MLACSGLESRYEDSEARAVVLSAPVGLEFRCTVQHDGTAKDESGVAAVCGNGGALRSGVLRPELCDIAGVQRIPRLPELDEAGVHAGMARQQRQQLRRLRFLRCRPLL